RAEHLHGLAGVLDGHLVVKDRWGLAQKVRRDHRKQGGEAIFVVGQRIGECLLYGAPARTKQQIDVSNFVAVADYRLASTSTTDLGHETPSLMGYYDRTNWRALAAVPPTASWRTLLS